MINCFPERLLRLLFCCFAAVLPMQEAAADIVPDSAGVAHRSFDAEAVERYRKLRDFDYETPARFQRTDQEAFLRKAFNGLMRWLFDNRVGRTTYGELVFYIIVALTIGFAVFSIFGLRIRGLFLRKAAGMEGEYFSPETDIATLSFGQMIGEAERSEDYRLALRLRFLEILKQLTEAGHIKWKLHKTNRDYVRDLRKSAFSAEFEQIVRWYEYAWYGEFPLDNRAYESALSTFNRFRRQAQL